MATEIVRREAMLGTEDLPGWQGEVMTIAVAVYRSTLQWEGSRLGDKIATELFRRLPTAISFHLDLRETYHCPRPTRKHAERRLQQRRQTEEPVTPTLTSPPIPLHNSTNGHHRANTSVAGAAVEKTRIATLTVTRMRRTEIAVGMVGMAPASRDGPGAEVQAVTEVREKTRLGERDCRTARETFTDDEQAIASAVYNHEQTMMRIESIRSVSANDELHARGGWEAKGLLHRLFVPIDDAHSTKLRNSFRQRSDDVTTATWTKKPRDFVPCERPYAIVEIQPRAMQIMPLGRGAAELPQAHRSRRVDTQRCRAPRKEPNGVFSQWHVPCSRHEAVEGLMMECGRQYHDLRRDSLFHVAQTNYVAASTYN